MFWGSAALREEKFAIVVIKLDAHERQGSCTTPGSEASSNDVEALLCPAPPSVRCLALTSANEAANGDEAFKFTVRPRVVREQGEEEDIGVSSCCHKTVCKRSMVDSFSLLEYVRASWGSQSVLLH